MTPGGLILVVDDDPKTAQSIRLYLEHDGFQVETVHNGRAALERLEYIEPQAIVLDVMLPGVDGLTLCRSVRARRDVPILMVSARTQEPDRLAGLHVGADDYITKPFSLRELVARVHAVLRRCRLPAPGSYGLLLDAAKFEATLQGTPLKLTPSEFRVLRLFVDSPARVYTREEIIRLALGPDFDGFDRTVDAHIMNVRRKVRNAGGPPQIIATVFGVGYRLRTPDEAE
jgi:DNA-binding response OmpR family regulator